MASLLRQQQINEFVFRQEGEHIPIHRILRIVSRPLVNKNLGRQLRQPTTSILPTPLPDARGPQSHTTWAVTFPVPNTAGNAPLICAISTDITDRKRAEEELRTARDLADSANRAKSEFLSSMSHELRTPLNAILGFAQVLELDSKDPLTDRQQESVSNIMMGGHHLLELINQVLELSKIEAGKLDLSIETVKPAAVLEDCLITAQSMAEPRSISVVNEAVDKDLPAVRTDPTRFKQVLLNLLSNAVKYNRDAGTVTVDAEEVSHGMLRVSVGDTGLGIAPENHEKIFEPFDRIGKETTDIEGTGIGLAISKQLMEALGGFIGLEPKTRKGSTFWIELPLVGKAGQKAPALDQPEDRPALPSSRKRRSHL